MKAFFNAADCKHARELYIFFVCVQLAGIDVQLETQLFLFVTSGLLFLELCSIDISCQQKEKPKITNINVI